LNIVWLVLSIAIWGLVHSWLASLQIKSALRGILGTDGNRYYRLLYNGFSVVSILPILWLMFILPDRPLYQVPAPWNSVMSIGQALAGLLLLTGVVQTGLFSFVGLSQLFESETPPVLVTTGLYRLVRHPLYSAGLLFLWLTPGMSFNTFTVYAAGSLYLIVGAFFEERKLLREFGPVYDEYRKITPMFVPGLILHS
jgi:protein-S-isoprenylcysteine O-methyltransferase Ste14